VVLSLRLVIEIAGEMGLEPEGEIVNLVVDDEQTAVFGEVVLLDE
jgi:hypothetical protein